LCAVAAVANLMSFVSVTAEVPTISSLVSSEVFSYCHVDDINLLGENTSVINHMGATNVQ
jgi:hypothetical protein